jgi:AraC-like DNA-binding protein
VKLGVDGAVAKSMRGPMTERILQTASATLHHAKRERASGPEHAHDHAMIFVPLAGTLRFHVASDTLIADPQHAVVVRAHTLHSYESSVSVEWFIAYVDDSAFTHLPPVFRFPNTAFVRELAAEMLREPRDDLAAAATLLLCAQIDRGYTLADPLAPLPDDDRLANAIRFARDHYSARVSTRELANVAGMSPRAFERALVRATGVTPRRLVEDLRLAEARERLATGRETVSAVASDVGYKSASHFVRRFRAAFGVTPTGLARSGQATPRAGKRT